MEYSEEDSLKVGSCLSPIMTNKHQNESDSKSKNNYFWVCPRHEDGVSSRIELDDHLKKLHLINGAFFVCGYPECTSVFPDSLATMEHISIIHKAFPDTVLTEDNHAHNTRKALCPQHIHDHFHTRGALFRHIQNKHYIMVEDTKIFTCLYVPCTNKSNRAASMIYHLINKHGLKLCCQLLENHKDYESHTRTCDKPAIQQRRFKEDLRTDKRLSS